MNAGTISKDRESLAEDLMTGKDSMEINENLKPIIPKKKYPSYVTDSFHNLKTRESVNFDPFEKRTAYSKRTKKSKMFGKLQEFSLRTGAVGYASAIMGTGLLALPNAVANVGWGGAIILIIFAVLCHLYGFYLITHAQSSVTTSKIKPQILFPNRISSIFFVEFL